MTTVKPNIVVVTPVKNESWILDRFLSVTSQFADVIIVADQCSTDDSVDICARYPKVVLVENRSTEYDEASRQKLLLAKARELAPEPRIILALDSDEILAADALSTPGWQTMLSAAPGTVLCFEKPDLYTTPDQCIRHNLPWPIGYVDDGAEQTARKIHSIRIPMPEDGPRLYVHDVKFMHYALLRPDAQVAKQRMYSMFENVNGTSPSRRRRVRYAANFDYSTVGRVEPTPPSWFAGWHDLGIDMRSITCYPHYWYDYEALRQFGKHGSRRFWPDDIWANDWEAFRLYAKTKQIDGVPDAPIVGPPLWYRLRMNIMDRVVATGRSILKRLGGVSDGRWK